MKQEIIKDIKALWAEENVLRRNLKDSVFTRIFRESKYLLQMYRSLHPEDTTTTEADLKTITLEPIFIKDLTREMMNNSI